MDTGKLYKEDNEFVANINYRLFSASGANCAGEFVLTEYKRLEDGDGYIIELEDGRRSRCSLRKRVNRAVSSIPPLYHYHFKGYEISE